MTEKSPKIKKGTLYGIGVGPGDPELMTLKAKRVIEESDVIFAPKKSKESRSHALSIVSECVDLSAKKVMEPVFKMSGGRKSYLECGEVATDDIVKELDKGHDVAMITLGDVSIYSTFMYVQQYVVDRGYACVVIPGIPSFCAGAALANIPLVLDDECLAVVPSVNDTDIMNVAMKEFDCTVVMKAGSDIENIAEKMKSNGIGPEQATIISNVGMNDEYVGAMDLERKYGYFTTVIVKKR